MISFPSTVILVILGFGSLIQSDPLTLDVEIKCAFNMFNWCAKLHIYEEDKYPKAHDIIQYTEFCTTDVIKRFHYSDIYLKGDQSPMYEIKYQLHHNCTPDVFYRCLTPKKAILVGKDGEQHAKIDIDAYGNGHSEECPPPNGR